MRVAVDTQEGDNAPAALIAGALLASEQHNCEITLLGDPDVIMSELSGRQTPESLEIVAVDGTLGKPSSIRRPHSAVAKGAKLVSQGLSDALVSAADTGLVLATALKRMGRLPGVQRPAVAAGIPTPDAYVLALDVGANPNSQPDHLVGFAQMGSVYASACMSVRQPRIGLLNIGHEEEKGSDLIREAHQKLKATHLPGYLGFVEPYALLSGGIDVLVTDGFSGNVLVKSLETASKMYETGLRTAFASKWQSRLGYLLARSDISAVSAKADPNRYGGAALLGVNGVVVVAHSGAGADAVCSAIRQANEAHSGNVLERMARGLAAFTAQGSPRRCNPTSRNVG